jgi:hypothetical protein
MLLAINVMGQKVTTDSAPNVDFSKYKTYSWGEGTPANDPLTAQRIVAGIDTQLVAKGYSKVESGGDLLVMYHVATTNRNLLTGITLGAGAGSEEWVSPGRYSHCGSTESGSRDAAEVPLERNCD